MRHITLIIAALVLAFAAPAFSGKGGNTNGGDGNGGSSGGGGGNITPPTGSCTVSGNVVIGAGLPTDQVINFMVAIRRALGVRPRLHTRWHTGPSTCRAGRATTYEFVSRTYGVGGSKYDIFAELLR